MDEHESELRRLRLEARAQQEEAEAAAGELAAATRTMREALLDEGRQGHGVRVDVGGVELSGRIEHVGDRLVRVCSNDGLRTVVVISAITAVRVLRNDPHPALVSVGYPQTIEARLREWVQVGAEVEIGRTQGLAVRGELRAVTPTHVELLADGDSSWLVPLEAVAWTRRL